MSSSGYNSSVALSKDCSPSPMPPSQPPMHQSDNVAHALAGAGGGLVAATLTYPLITLSTRAQIESKKSQCSTIDAARQIIRCEGVRGLYSGLESALFGISVTNFVYYYWFELNRTLFEAAAIKAGRESLKLTAIESMIAGAVAGSATVLITNPIWVVNTRMTARVRQNSKQQKDAQSLEQTSLTGSPQNMSGSSSESPESSSSSSSLTSSEFASAQPATAEGAAPSASSPSPSQSSSSTPRQKVIANLSTLQTFLSIIREEGVLALFSGVIPALVLVINPIVQYTVYEQLKNALVQRRRASAAAAGISTTSAAISTITAITPRDSLFLGAIGKLLATTITYPYITVKSRMYVAGNNLSSSSSSSSFGSPRKPPSTTAILRQIIREEGWAGVYAGIVPKVTQSVITAALLFAFKDVLYNTTVKTRRLLVSS